MATVIGSRREARLRYLLFMRTLLWRRYSLLGLSYRAMKHMDQYVARVQNRLLLPIVVIA